MNVVIEIMVTLSMVGIAVYIKTISDNLDDKLDDLSMIECQLANVLSEFDVLRQSADVSKDTL